MEPDIIFNLLSNVSQLTKKYEEIAAITGENFNIFKILKVEASEVRTHSFFLAELLNSKGNHGCKDIFLKIFLQQQKNKHSRSTKFLERLDRFSTENSSSFVEQHLGFISEDKTEGGRIDILLLDNSRQAIIVENKIYAKDQLKQLIRYNNSYKNAPIFYLTLFGANPSSCSSGQLKEGDEYVCISYRDDIIAWLTECIKEAANYPLLRETLKQYIILIKYLTGQAMNVNLTNEVVQQIILSKDNIKASFTIAEAHEKMKIALLDILSGQLETEAKNTSLITYNDEFGERPESYFHFNIPNSKYGTSITLGFDKDKRDFSIGVYINTHQELESLYPLMKTLIGKKLESAGTGKDKNYPNWAYLHYFTDDLRDWNINKEVWIGILDKTTVTRLMKIVSNVYQNIKDMDL